MFLTGSTAQAVLTHAFWKRGLSLASCSRAGVVQAYKHKEGLDKRVSRAHTQWSLFESETSALSPGAQQFSHRDVHSAVGAFTADSRTESTAWVRHSWHAGGTLKRSWASIAQPQPELYVSLRD